MRTSFPVFCWLMVGFAASLATGQTFTWVGPATGNWSSGANWSGGAMPSPDAIVRVDGGAGQNSAVTLDVPATVHTLDISAGDSLIVPDGIVLTLSRTNQAAIQGPGTLTLGTALGAARLEMPVFSTVRGGGTLHLARYAFVIANGGQINHQDYAVVGAGQISSIVHTAGTSAFVQARAPAGASGLFATLELSAGDQIVNSGLMSAAPGATLSFNTPTLTGSGTLQALSGATVSLRREMTVSGLTLAAQAGGIIVAPPAELGNDRITLSNVTNLGLFRAERSDTRLAGTITNAGTIAVETPNAAIRLGTGTTHITGGGAMRLGGFPLLGDATATLRQTNHTIHGNGGANGITAGTILNGAGGVIDANLPGQRLTLAPVAAMSNSGLLQASNGGELLLAGSAAVVDNRFGRIAARDTGSRVLMNQSTRIFGGTIETDPSAEVLFDAPAGTFTLDNAVNLGRLRVARGRLSAGGGGIFINSGTLTLGTVSINEPFSFAGGGDVVLAGNVSGTATNLGNRITGSGSTGVVLNTSGGIVEADAAEISVAGGSTNAGLMRAGNGGTLALGALNNTGGRIEAVGGGIVRYATISGGTLAALAGGAFAPASIFSALTTPYTLLGPGTFAGGSTLTTRYSLANGNSISLGENPILDGGALAVAGSATAQLIGTNRAVTLKDIALNAGNATLNLTSGTLNIAGTVFNRLRLNTLAPAGEINRIMPVGVATLAGGGAIVNVGGDAAPGRLVNLDNTITFNAGSFGAWTGGWENYGTLTPGTQANLIVRTNTNPINRGFIGGGHNNQLEIIGVGTIATAPVPSGTLDNFGGVIAAGTNSVLLLRNVAVIGGTVDARWGSIVAVGTQSAARMPDSGGNTVDHLPAPTSLMDDVTILGQGLSTGVGRLRVKNVNLASDAVLTVGDPDLAGGSLILDLRAILSGSGIIRTLPTGHVVSSGFGTLNGVSIVGTGTLIMPEMTINSESAIVARAEAGAVGEALLVVQPSSASSFVSVKNLGTLAAETGARLHIGSLSSGSAYDVRGDSGTIIVQAGATISTSCFVTAGPIRNDGTFAVLSRTTTAGIITGSGDVRVTSGTLLARQVRQRSLALESGTAAQLIYDGGVSRLQTLSIAGSGSLDFRNNALVLDYDTASPITEIRSLIASGYAGGAWGGPGIVTRVVGVASRAVGYAEATDLGLAGGTFLGEPVDSTSLLLRYTLGGDANLDGSVGIADFARVAMNFNQPGFWSHGDFNYDGATSLADFALLAGNFNKTAAGEAGARAASVPEAGSFGLLVAAGLMCRCRRGRAVAPRVA